MCKLEIKYAYFLVPLNKESRKMRGLSIVRQLIQVFAPALV